MPDHNLSKLYLMSPAAYSQMTLNKNAVAKEKKIVIKKKTYNSKTDPINKWNEKNRELQMKLLTKLKKHRKLEELRKPVEEPARIINQTLIPEDLDSLIEEDNETQEEHQVHDKTPLVSNKEKRNSPKSSTPFHTRLAAQSHRPYYGIVPGHSKKILVTKTPKPQNFKRKFAAVEYERSGMTPKMKNPRLKRDIHAWKPYETLYKEK